MATLEITYRYRCENEREIDKLEASAANRPEWGVTVDRQACVVELTHEIPAPIPTEDS